MPTLPDQLLHWIESDIKRKKFGLQPPSLYEPVRYLMQLGGKRLRPMLTLISYSLFRDDIRSVVPYATAVEAFHNFTLMHDDIMDKAPLRRGKATVHKKWDVNTAILSGDVMLVKVYDMFSKLEPRVLKEVLLAFNECAARVCEGQQWDMEFEKRKNVSEQEYLGMIRQKTAVLLGFSLELGGILGGADLDQRQALSEFGTNVGTGFQLKDDLLDAYADPRKFGKQVGGDILANKKTYLLIKALELADQRQRKELRKWLDAKNVKKRMKVDAVRSIYDELGIQSLTQSRINAYFRKGFKDLDRLTIPEHKKKKLRDFTGELIERQF